MLETKYEWHCLPLPEYSDNYQGLVIKYRGLTLVGIQDAKGTDSRVLWPTYGARTGLMEGWVWWVAFNMTTKEWERQAKGEDGLKNEKILNRGNSIYKDSGARENVVCSRSQKLEVKCEGRRGDCGARLHVSSQHASGWVNYFVC